MDSVLVAEINCGSDFVIGHAQLNVESTLNSLSLEMVRALVPALESWRHRDDIVAVLITAAGERAFCAGGDIQALYRAVSKNQDAGTTVDPYPYDFFAEEYRLDHALHTYPKPVMTLGQGIVMGGGLGIFGGSSHRVVTETSRLAVPEITIGLFPDAGGTWTLGRMPPAWASFLGMTGSHVNAADALACGLATHLVAQEHRLDVCAGLRDLRWSQDAEHNSQILSEYLSIQDEPTTAPSELQAVPLRDVVVDDLGREVAHLNELAGVSKWVDRGLNNLAKGCPTTAGIVLEQLRRVPELGLGDSFRLELNVATHCARNPDFREGVRALLIDKDNSPAWQFGSIESLDWAYVLSHFEPSWDVHPLADLV